MMKQFSPIAARRGPGRGLRVRRTRERRGAALVETAVCLPVILLFIFGSLECCNALFLRQALSTAAYEAARVAIGQDSTNTQTRDCADAVLAARNVEDGTVAFSPGNVAEVERGNYITVTVSAPFGDRAFLPSSLLRGSTLASSVTMVKE